MIPTIFFDVDDDLARAGVESTYRRIQRFKNALRDRAAALGWVARFAQVDSPAWAAHFAGLTPDQREEEAAAWQQVHDLLDGPGPLGGWRRLPTTLAMRRHFAPSTD